MNPTVEKGNRTKHTRIAEDLAEKLADIHDVEDTSSATFLDPLIRTEIENRHKANLPAITALREARERAQKRREEADAVELGESGA